MQELARKGFAALLYKGARYARAISGGGEKEQTEQRDVWWV